MATTLQLDPVSELVAAVRAHQRYWQRVNWDSEAAEHRVLEALERVEKKTVKPLTFAITVQAPPDEVPTLCQALNDATEAMGFPSTVSVL